MMANALSALPLHSGNQRSNAFGLAPRLGAALTASSRWFTPLIANRERYASEVAASVGIEEVTKGGKFSTNSDMSLSR